LRTLSSTLLAAQKAEARTPELKVEVRNDPLGVVNLVWERLYSGSEADGRHALAAAGDGSLIRLRISPASDNRKVYRQRVSNPGSGSDFSTWTYQGSYNAVNGAACARGAEVSLFWIKANGEINYLKSPDYGATWSSLEYPGSGSGAAVVGMSAAYRSNGDLFLFFTDTSNLCLIRRLNGVWQTCLLWNKISGALSGVAVVYDGDWKLLVGGLDANGHNCLWSLVYGDGAELPAGSWGDLKLMLKAPAGSGYAWGPVFLDKADSYRYFCNESYSGNEAYSRPLRANMLPASAWSENLWTEPQAFNFQNESGLAMAHDSSYAWLACSSGVWRASLATVSLDLSADILTLQQQASGERGQAAIELLNEDGKYALAGSGGLTALVRGGRLDIAPGYQTAAGREYSPALSLVLRGLEYTRGGLTTAGGKTALVLYATDAWDELRGWKARYPLRWNGTSPEVSVMDLLAHLLARAGLKLSVISHSERITTFYPDFLIPAGENGAVVVEKLLSYVPDRLFIEGGLAYLVYPLETDAAVYHYAAAAGAPLPADQQNILEGRYRQDGAVPNRVQVEGWDSTAAGGAGCEITQDAFNWTELEYSRERLTMLQDINLKTAALVSERGQIILCKASQTAQSGWIRAAMNCGLQILDPVAINDPAAGLNASLKRVTAYSWSYRPERGEYEQIVYLGGG
jgi:hypothetical protein